MAESIYRKSSLAMIPYGALEGELPSIKPENGDGDFTFSRGTDTATRVNASGLIEKERANLILHSNDFSNAAWVKLGAGTGSAAVVTSGFTDPNGGSNAWRLQCDLNGGTTSSDQSLIYQLGSGTGVTTFSYYVKSNTGSNQNFAFGNDLNGYSQVTATTSWQRFEVFVNTASTRNSFIGSRGTTGSDDTLDILIYAAQVEQGLVATDYIETTSSAVYEGITDNLPRLDYSGGASCPSLLLEPSRTNLFPYSNYFGTDWVLTAATITTNATTSPEGVDNASLYTSSNATNSITDVITAANGTYTLSAFFKRDATDNVRMNLSDGVTGEIRYVFNLADETSTLTKSGGTISDYSADFENYGNGWYRLHITATTNAGTAITAYFETDNETGSFYLYGAQLEAGSYPTSYIPTYGTAASRAGDDCEKTGVSSLIGQTEGTLFTEFSIDGDTSIIRNVINVNSGSAADFVAVFFFNDLLYARIRANSGSLISVTKSGVSSGTHKLAVAYADNDLTFYLDGSFVAQDTNASVSFASALSKLSVGKGTNDTDELGDGIKQALLFKTRLTNAELATLTTL